MAPLQLARQQHRTLKHFPSFHDLVDSDGTNNADVFKVSNNTNNPSNIDNSESVDTSDNVDKLPSIWTVATGAINFDPHYITNLHFTVVLPWLPCHPL